MNKLGTKIPLPYINEKYIYEIKIYVAGSRGLPRKELRQNTTSTTYISNQKLLRRRFCNNSKATALNTILIPP